MSSSNTSTTTTETGVSSTGTATVTATVNVTPTNNIITPYEYLIQTQKQILENPTVDHFRQILSYPTVSSFVAGGVAGAVSRTVVSPFERMKIIFQIQGPGSAAYQGVLPTLSKMWRDEGWRGFMRGNGTNCIRIVPYSAVQFSTYTILKAYIVSSSETPINDPTGLRSRIPNQNQQNQNQYQNSTNTITNEKLLAAPASKIASSMDNMGGRSLTAIERLSAGSIAGVASVAVTYPLDIIRTRLSIQTASIGNLREHYQNIGQKPPGIMSVGRQIYATEGGWLGLYRGIIPTTMGVAPYVGINFAVYEWMRELIIDYTNQPEPSAFGKLAAGAASGAVAQTLTYPFDVLRRRFQVISMDKSAGIGYQYSSVWNALSTIVKSEGFWGLYKGLSANLLKVVPSMAASWLSFEYVKDLLAY